MTPQYIQLDDPGLIVCCFMENSIGLERVKEQWLTKSSTISFHSSYFNDFFSFYRTVRPSVCPSRFRVRSISPIFFEVGIPNLVCGYTLGWGGVAYHFRVTVTLTLTSDLVFRIIVSGAYLLYYLR